MSKKLIISFVAFATIVAVVVPALLPAQAASIVTGDLVKASTACKGFAADAVYEVSGSNLKVYPYLSVYLSWGYPSNFSTTKTVACSDLDSYTVEGYAKFRNGSAFRGTKQSVKGTYEARSVYYTENGKIRPISSCSVYNSLFGVTDCKSQTYWVPDAFVSTVNYDEGAMISSTATLPEGLFVKLSSGKYGVVGSGNTVREFSSDAAITANRYDTTKAVNTTAALASGTSITGAESGLLLVSTQAIVTTPTGLVTVALASDYPAAGSIVADDTAGVMTNTPIVKLTFANGSSTAVNVNTLKLTRLGISADADLNNVYLYEGDTWVADMASSGTKTYTFNSSTGLFTVPANGTKTLTVKGQLAVSTAAGKTIGLSVNAATDVTLSAGTLSGTFPINSNIMTTALVTDLGYINIATFTTFPATIDPGLTAQELWRFTTTATSQEMNIHKIVMTMVGTIATGDVTNLKLNVNNVQVGSTASIGSDNKVTFDLSGSPYKITKGQSKIFILTGDVVKGTGRAFKFTLRTVSDFVAKDVSYGVFTTPLRSSAAFTVIDPDTSGDGTNINNGTLTVSVATDSPTGNIGSGVLDVPLARFNYKANGEDVKVSYVNVSVNEESSDQDIDNGKLYYNGSQVGTTDTAVADGVTVIFSLGNTVIIPAGTTGVFEYRADTTQGGGTALAANQTLVVSLVAGTTDATGQTSLTNIATSAATGKTLTVKTGILSLTKNSAVADATSTNPTGVPGTAGVKVASMIFTAGTGEGANLTQIVVGDDPGVATSDFGATFQNLRPMHGTTQLATTQGTLSSTEGVDYTFSISPTVTIPAGNQYKVDWYADIKTITPGAGYYATAEVGLEFVSASATGVNTGGDVTTSLSVTDLQKLLVSTTGTLTISANASTPLSDQLVMGITDATLAILDFKAGAAENINVSKIIVTDTTSFGGSLGDLKLYDGSTQIGSGVESLSAETDGIATFNLTTPWVVTKNTTKALTVKGSVNAYGSAVSGGSHVANIADSDAVDSIGASSGTGITETVSSATGNTMYVYRGKAIVTKNSSSPSGSASTGTNATVLKFDVAATAYDAILNAVAITMSGSVDTTGSSSAYLYKEGSSTAIATEAYATESNATSGSTTTWLNAGITGGIPVGANIRIYDDSATGYMVGTFEVTAVSSTGYTFTPAAAVAVAANDDIYYRPMQPGTGKVYFGAQTTLTADLADAATSATVTSTDGFSYGDTVYVAGYNSTGTAVTRSSGCVITDLTSTTITMSACQLSNDDTIDFNYVSATAANAITKGQNSAAIVYTGNIGETISTTSPKIFTVKGDTIGATTAETLGADIAATSDLNWDDQEIHGVYSITKSLPIYGGTLTY